MERVDTADAQLEAIRAFMHAIPFNRELGLRVVELGVGRALLEIPFRPGLVGDEARPALHGGVLSALVDTAGGAAVWTRIGPADRCSTIDLRVDYLRPGRLVTIRALAQVLRVGNRVGVASVRAFHVDAPDEAIAEGKGVYSVRRES